MARSRQTITKTRTRVKKNGSANKGGYMVCNVCGGRGIQKVPKRKKK